LVSDAHLAHLRRSWNVEKLLLAGATLSFWAPSELQILGGGFVVATIIFGFSFLSSGLRLTLALSLQSLVSHHPSLSFFSNSPVKRTFGPNRSDPSPTGLLNAASCLAVSFFVLASALFCTQHFPLKTLDSTFSFGGMVSPTGWSRLAVPRPN